MKRLTTEEFIDRAKAVHGGRYDYSKVHYVTAQDDVEIICPVHGVFIQKPYNHLRGYGCAICNKIDSRRMGIDEFIARSIGIHGFLYNYSHVDYVNEKTEVEIICPLHGAFLQKPEKHLLGHGCPMCCKNLKDTTESFVAKARKIHGSLYDYSKVDYVDQHTKVCIIDSVYGEFWQQPNAHLNGEGCPFRKGERCHLTKKANGTENSSKPEELAKQLLYDKFGKDDVKIQYHSDKYPFACDFYIVSLGLYIELNLYVTHGGHWFDPENEEDVQRLNLIQSRATGRNMYANMIKVWTVSDPLKKQTAEDNNLNYKVFWDNDLTDFMQWYDSIDV